MSVKDIEVPTGLDLHPRPPVTMRLSKRAGILALLLVGGTVALVVFGIYGRQQKKSQPAHSPADDRSIVAATDAGRQIAEENSAKPHNAAEEVAPADEKLELQPPADTSRERRRPAGNSENSSKAETIRAGPCSRLFITQRLSQAITKPHRRTKGCSLSISASRKQLPLPQKWLCPEVRKERLLPSHLSTFRRLDPCFKA